MALHRDHDGDPASIALQVRSFETCRQRAWPSTLITLAQVTYRLASSDHFAETYFGLIRGFHRLCDTYVPLWMDSGSTRSQDLGGW
jgi:hypothetical protein